MVVTNSLFQLPDEALIRWPQLKTVVPRSRVTLWRMEKAGTFPQSIMIGPRTKCWRWGEVRAWLNEQGGAV